MANSLTLALISTWNPIIHGYIHDYSNTPLVNFFIVDYTIDNFGKYIKVYSKFISNLERYRRAGYFPKLSICKIINWGDYILAVDKTYLIISIQRRWKRYFNRKKRFKYLLHREITGKFPRN